MRLKFFILGCLLLFAVYGARAQETAKQHHKKWYQLFKINCTDKQGKQHGRWKVYFGENNQIIRNGRFRHGKEAGKWKYYYTDGSLYMIEKYSRRNNTILVEKYHQNGKLARKGTARHISTPTIDRYFWFGDWLVYDERGNYTHTETYQSGNLVHSSVK